jgi:site-specific DNA-methyltransferase (adenine-specific)
MITIGKATIHNMDCMELLKATPDKFYDLAIVDPPYGIGNWCPSNISKQGVKASLPVTWNDSIPDLDYFEEVLRVSKNQIIWGANYYNSFAKLGGSLVWHKGNINPVFSQCEIASLSFQKRVDYVHIDWQAGFARKKEGETIHPCQKPIKLYEWLLTNYAKPNDKILDTHLGSGSHAIACNNLGFELTACELDKDYYKASIKRIKQATAQERLFA